MRILTLLFLDMPPWGKEERSHGFFLKSRLPDVKTAVKEVLERVTGQVKQIVRYSMLKIEVP